MRQYHLLAALLSLILLTCLFGIEAQYYIPQQSEVVGRTTQYPTSTVSYPTPAQTSQVGQTSQTTQYSQYYTMGRELNTHVTAPQPFVTEGNTPSTVYLGQQQQPVAYSQYQATSGTGNTLWIKGPDSWAQYAEVPQGATVTLLAISPNGGNGYVSETSPNGQAYNYNYFFYPASQLTFYADTLGRYTLSSVVAGQTSNQVVIDVKETAYNPPSYYNPPRGYPSAYYPGYYSYYYPYISPILYPSYLPNRYYGYPYYYGYGFGFFPHSTLGQELAWRMEAYNFLNSPW